MKPPIYRDGELACPHCEAPLLTEESLEGKFHCVFCKNEVGKLTEENLKRMVDDFPEDLLKEWLIESSPS